MKRTSVCLLAIVAVVSAQPRAGGAPPAKSAHPSMAQFMSFAFPGARDREDGPHCWWRTTGLRNVCSGGAALRRSA